MVIGTSTLREAPLVSFSYRPKMSVHILSVVFRSIHTQGPFWKGIIFSHIKWPEMDEYDATALVAWWL